MSLIYSYFYHMKLVYLFLFIIVVAAAVPSCKKDTFITSPNAFVRLSVDTLNFDTVFTGSGSITQYFKVFNQNNQKLRLSEVKLMGGANSYFKLNVDGTPGTSFAGLEMEANDSLYGFVMVNINKTTATTPFVIRDSIRITYNGDTTYLQLTASGQNANFLKNTIINKDTTWTNNLPIVISGGVTVNAGATLTIQQGAKVYLGAHSPIFVNGSLQAFGESDTAKRINFMSDRLDMPYNNQPGSWPGIYFNSTSSNNILQYCNIKNANEGVSVAAQGASGNTMLTLNQCMFNNIKDIAIGGVNASIAANNCLISNCGNNVVLSSGGNYSFNQCTIVGYSNVNISHESAVMRISNTDSSGKVYNLNCLVVNSIVYGVGGLVGDELAITKKAGANYNVAFTNTLYKAQDAILSVATFTGCLPNQLPMFVNVNTDTANFNFHLAGTSPCIKAGTNTAISVDLEGNARPSVSPDLGCYQR